jgi:hypothetical protein
MSFESSDALSGKYVASVSNALSQTGDGQETIVLASPNDLR